MTDSASASLEGSRGLLIGAFIVIIFNAVLGFLLFNYWDKKRLLALLMLQAPVAGFCLLAIIMPMAAESAYLPVLIFASLLAMFKFLNRFESKAWV